MENDIPILDPLAGSARFRSVDNTSGFVANQTTIDKTGPAGLSSFPNAPSSRSNSTNVYPYGNVPLAFLQQQIPADIKIAGSRKPSFYQWPFVGASQAANFLFGKIELN